MTKRGEPLSINQALNRPRAKLGLDHTAWMAIVFVCVTVFLVGFRLLAMLAFPTLAVGAWLIVRKHPKMFQLWGLSLNQRATMTRVNTEQLKHTPWFAKAGAACSIVPIARFVGPEIFALKGGGYGCLFALTGIDEEGLTDFELERECDPSKAHCAACRRDRAFTSTPV